MFVSDLLKNIFLLTRFSRLICLLHIIDTIKNFEKKLTGKILQKKKKKLKNSFYSKLIK